MSLEIRHGNNDYSGRQYCGSCFVVAENPNVLEGGPIMVARNSGTDKTTKLGSSMSLGHVVVAVPFATSYVGNDRRVHLRVPISTATQFREVRRSGRLVTLGVADAHDLKPLP